MPVPRPAFAEKAAAPSPATFDVLCVGLLCADLVFSVPHHPAADEKLRASGRLLAPGGPAAVAAAQVARLGGRAAFAGMVGDDPFAAILHTALLAEGIDTSALLCLPGHETPLSALLVKPDASRSVVSHRPAPGQTVANLAALPPARVLLADGHRPEWTPALLALARATGAPLVLDAGSWTEAVRALAPFAGHLVASEACARTALGGLDPASVPSCALREALQASATATVVVTLGPRGLVWHDAAAGGAYAAFRINATDTTGAGDAFHGAYAFALARDLPAHSRLRLASAAGALACTREGAWNALADSSAIETFLAARPS